MNETGKVFLLIRRHTALVLRLLTFATLALEGSEDRKQGKSGKLGEKCRIKGGSILVS